MARHRFEVELKERDYLELLKHAPRDEPVTVRLVAAEHVPGRQGGVFIFRGSRADGMTLRLLAMLHAPGALARIEKRLEEATS